MVFVYLFYLVQSTGLDLGSSRLFVLAATHFATLHRPTTTPTRNDLCKQTPKSAHINSQHFSWVDGKGLDEGLSLILKCCRAFLIKFMPFLKHNI